MTGTRESALQALDEVLANEPGKVGHDFSEATRRLTAYRQELIQAWRGSRDEADRKTLDAVNSALSVVVGAQFPLGGVPWDSLRQARSSLGSQVR